MYANLLSRSDPDTEASIEKDLSRTFPDIPEFKEPGSSGKNRLYNILKAYAQYDFKVGYCQGLNYVAAMLLLYINKEELAFFTLVHIMYNFEWRGVYIENMPKLTALLKTLSKEIKARLPDVYAHLKKLEIDLAGLFSHIFLTVFVYRTPFDLAVKIFDLFMLEREKILIAAVINMLRIMKDKIISYNCMVLILLCSQPKILTKNVGRASIYKRLFSRGLLEAGHYGRNFASFTIKGCCCC